MRHAPAKRRLSESTRGLARKARRLLYKCPVVFFGAVLYLMYVMTVGEMMFFSKGSFAGAELQKASTVLFVAASCVSQVLFFFFSSYSTGLVSSPISESFVNVHNLQKSLVRAVPPDKLFTNLFLCTSLASLFTSAGFFLMYILRAEKTIKKIPSGVSKALFVAIGFLCVSYANERIGSVKVEAVSSLALTLCFNVVGVLITLLCFVCEKRCPAVSQYSVLWVGVLFTIIFYACVWKSGKSVDSLMKTGWLLKDPRESASLTVLPLVVSDIEPAIIIKELPAILKISAMNLLQFPINFPPTNTATGGSASARKELLANGVCNAASAFLGCATQVLPSSTIAVHKAGSKSRTDTLWFAAALAAVILGAYRYMFYIPFAVFDLLFLCLGLNIVLQAGISAAREGWRVLLFVASISLISFVTSSILWGAAAAVFSCALWHFLVRKKEERARSEI